jgi:hypothetical protein
MTSHTIAGLVVAAAVALLPGAAAAQGSSLINPGAAASDFRNPSLMNPGAAASEIRNPNLMNPGAGASSFAPGVPQSGVGVRRAPAPRSVLVPRTRRERTARRPPRSAAQPAERQPTRTAPAQTEEQRPPARSQRRTEDRARGIMGSVCRGC